MLYSEELRDHSAIAAWLPGDVVTAFDRMFYSAEQSVESTERDIRKYAAQIRSALDRVDEYLEKGYTLNSFGELQTLPRDYDAAIKERNLAYTELTKLRNAVYVATGERIKLGEPE